MISRKKNQIVCSNPINLNTHIFTIERTYENVILKYIVILNC